MEQTQSSPDNARRVSRLGRLAAALQRVPWLIPAVSFAAGWISFAMVKRGEGLARLIALIALVGWVWLLIEPLVRRYLERRRAGVGKFVANFLTQSLQQEMLFFALPLMIGATQRDAGQIVFTSLAGAAAVLTTIDPVYERHVASRAATRLMFHAYCSVIAAVVVLPMVVHFPLERALPASLIGVGVWLLLTAPMSIKSLRSPRHKLIWISSSVMAPLLLWGLRAHVPPAGLAITQAVITQDLDDLTPGEPVRTVTQAELERGIVAFIAVRAPMGVAQSIVFEWRYRGESERIVEQIHGGSESGWRTYSRKQTFPENARGQWTVDILTPQRQLLKRLRFVVT